jgi:hypothetical protein
MKSSRTMKTVFPRRLYMGFLFWCYWSSDFSYGASPFLCIFFAFFREIDVYVVTSEINVSSLEGVKP